MVRLLHKETHGRQPGCLSFMLQILVRHSSDLHVSSSFLSSAGFRISVFTSDVCGLALASSPTTDLKTCICYLQYDLLYAHIIHCSTLALTTNFICILPAFLHYS